MRKKITGKPTASFSSLSIANSTYEDRSSKRRQYVTLLINDRKVNL